jgi:hypothetical protein
MMRKGSVYLQLLDPQTQRFLPAAGPDRSLPLHEHLLLRVAQLLLAPQQRAPQYIDQSLV